MKQKLTGTGVALVTPFLKDGQIDFKGLSKLVNHVIVGGVNYLVSLGTTGESSTLSKREKQEVLSFTVDCSSGKVPIVAGIGGNNTSLVINDLKSMNLNGVSAILSVSPYYNKPSQEGIYRHYEALSKASPLPIILYNVPGRTSSNLSAETTLRLANNFSNIIGIKEASGNIVQCMEIVRKRPEGFLVISGEDALTLPMMSFSMDGVISVIANLYPDIYSDMVNLAALGQFGQAKALHFKLLPLIDLIFQEGNPPGAKAGLELLGICSSYLRLPLSKISDALNSSIKQCIKQI